MNEPRRGLWSNADPRARPLATAHLVLVLQVVGIAGAFSGRLDDALTVFHPLANVVLLVYLWLILWWVMTQTLSPGVRGVPRMDVLFAAGVRWGAGGGALFAWGVLALWVLWGVKVALVGPEPDEYALVGGRWAFLWMAPIAAPIFGVVGLIGGAILGGVISVIDRLGLAIGYWALGPLDR